MVSRDLFCTLSYPLVFFFCPQFSGNFLKIAFFKKRVQNLGFSIFSVLSLNFENSLFLGLLKHYKNRGFSNFCVLCCLKRRKQAKKNDNWNFNEFGFFWSKNGRFVTHKCFSKKRPWNHYFYCVFCVRAFWAKLSKKGNFGHPAKKEENFHW